MNDVGGEKSLFDLIPIIDQIGQIELMNVKRQLFGDAIGSKRPDGQFRRFIVERSQRRC